MKQVDLKIFLYTTILLTGIFFHSANEASQQQGFHDKAFNFFIEGKIKNKGNLYQIKDFNPKAIIKVKNLVASGKLKQTIELETGNQNKHQHFPFIQNTYLT